MCSSGNLKSPFKMYWAYKGGLFQWISDLTSYFDTIGLWNTVT